MSLSHLIQYSQFSQAKQAHGTQFRMACKTLGGTDSTKFKVETKERNMGIVAIDVMIVFSSFLRLNI